MGREGRVNKKEGEGGWVRGGGGRMEGRIV